MKTLMIAGALMVGALLTGCESDQPHFSTNCLEIDGSVPYTGMTGVTATNTVAAARPINNN